MPKIWENTEIIDENGKKFEAIAPLIISASRATDIPAFYSKWFFDRLFKGYTKWINPFNKKNVQYISFEKVRIIVFWSKNPKPIIPYLKILDEKGINYYFQYTLNDYEDEKFEIGLPSLKERIKTFQALSKLIGKEKVIWRFDPLILTDSLNVENLLIKVSKIAQDLLLYTNKLVFSFVDIAIYKKVINNMIEKAPQIFNKDNILKSEFSYEQKIQFAKGIQNLQKDWKKINPNFTIATCAEDIDLKEYGIFHNKCIDDLLMVKLFNNNEYLMDFLGYELPEKLPYISKKELKDKGQRKNCNCIVSKDIGAYNTCLYKCIYCYANSKKNIKNNI
ncbi:MAG: DUF1848 domain-containing protein [Spirochaetales bacterium]|nr:DUF1848 domain-containing protein [Spirochaetales bacterium]